MFICVYDMLSIVEQYWLFPVKQKEKKKKQEQNSTTEQLHVAQARLLLFCIGRWTIQNVGNNSNSRSISTSLYFLES